MLGDIGIAEVSVFLILAWVSAAAVIATVVLYRLHFRKAFAIAAYSGLISLALVAWAYFSCGPSKSGVDPLSQRETLTGNIPVFTRLPWVGPTLKW